MNNMVAGLKPAGHIHLEQPGARERVGKLTQEMLERDRWPRERMQAYQQQRLRELVEHAVSHSPYYREVIGNFGGGEVELRQLPVLTKKTMMAHFDRILTDPRLRLADLEQHLTGESAASPLFDEYRAAGTGGTSGQRGITVYDIAAWEVALASIPHALAVQDIAAGARVLGIGAPTPLHMTNRLFGELHSGKSDAPRIAVTTPVPEMVEALNAYQPEAILTYPSVIRRLAEEQWAGRLRIAPRQFGSTAETLTDDVRELAKEIWGAPVLNTYGSTEAGVIGIECPWMTGLHIAEDRVIVEVVGENNRPVPPGAPGHKVLVTNLFNRTQPIIRYELSDLVTVARGPCLCGRQHLRLQSVKGRQEDLLDLPSRKGGRVKVHAFLLGETLLHMPAIRQYQLSRRPDGLLARVVLRDAERAEEVLQSARHAIAAELTRVGAVVGTLAIEAVDEIGRTGSGAKAKLVA